MAPCLFFPCFPMFLEETNKQQQQQRRMLYIDSASGAMRVPQYKKVRREACPMLQWSWEEEWNELLLRCLSNPEEALSVTEHSGRTALHLATFNHPSPLKVAQALLKANRHMVLVQDNNWYTPLHNVCFFPGEHLVNLFCDTAIMVEQELQGHGCIPVTSGTSPLFLAAKRAAPLSTLECLLATRSRTEWIAPSTGGEPYWDSKTLDEYSSPLEILLRDRAAQCFDIERIQENAELRNALRTIAYKQLSKGGRGRRIAKDDSDETKEETTAADFENPKDLEALRLWEKCIELLAEHCPLLLKNNDADLEFPFGVLHAVACVKVPIPSLLQVALAVVPEQTLQRDERGMIPLHHVLLANHPYATQTLVSTLLQHCPACALVALGGDDGPTPLSLALDRKLPVAILQELLKADSHITLGMVDPLLGLYPFCVAAARDYDLDVIYSLLVANPQVIGYHLSLYNAFETHMII
jgi:ankyrin repeat protein